MILPDASSSAKLPLETQQGNSCPRILDEILDAAKAPAGYTVADAETYLGIYQVHGDEIINPYFETVPSDLKDEQDDLVTQQNVWEYFATIIPAQKRGMISDYLILTDGPDNILAAVSQTRDDASHWVLEVDIADSTNYANLTFNMMHEFGHLLTLNADQVPPNMNVFNNPGNAEVYNQESALCPNYFPGEGCSQAGSYINQFYQRFWTNVYPEWTAIHQIDNQTTYYKKLVEFYEKHEDQFVSDYAVTSPAEDIAESWAHFIFAPKPEGDTIAGQKVLFFYDYPELVSLREEILNRVCSAFPQ